MLNHYKIRSNIALDIQGTIKESIEYPTSHLDYLKYHFERILENRALTKSDIVFVVTDQQKRDLENVLKHKRHMNTVFYQIRCGVDRVLTIEEKTYNRAKYRQRMGVQGDQTVFVYSGNRSKWQKINDVISYFKDIDRFLSNCFFAFFCNADDELKKQLSLSFDNNNYLCKLNNKDDYMGYLCACDVGIILRDYNNTNRVAFPNKFSDYLNAGLLIAMNKAIPEPYDLLLQYNIPFINTDIRPVERELDKIMYRKRNLYSYYDGCNRLCWNELDYQEQISKAQIKLD